ncbi:hypothetical protein KI387_029890, partial [Taxus chinensis]
EPECDQKKMRNIKHTGNISLDDFIKIVKFVKCRYMEKHLVGYVKEMMGTIVSIRMNVEGKDPKDLQLEVDEGE